MKKEYYTLLIIFCCFIILFSCQKEISWNLGSEGELAKDNDNNCAPVIINGNYIASQRLRDSNYLIVNLRITVPGNYKVYTDTVNGFYFKGGGKAASPGTMQVKLSSAGKPLTTETSHFNIFYNDSRCEATIVVN